MPFSMREKYSPDLNQIELAFSKLKGHLRKAAEHAILRLLRRIGRIVTDFSPQPFSQQTTCTAFVRFISDAFLSWWYALAFPAADVGSGSTTHGPEFSSHAGAGKAGTCFAMSAMLELPLKLLFSLRKATPNLILCPSPAPSRCRGRSR
jgi:hypothetical protein